VHHAVTVVHGLGHPALTTATAASPVTLVSGGPGRLIDIVLVLLLSFYVWRRPQPPVNVLWLAALVLASRCFFEAVMTPYYLAPPLMLALVMTARLGARRFWTAAILSLELSVFAYHHLEPWVWWIPIVSELSVILTLGYPGRHGDVDTSVDDERGSASQLDSQEDHDRRLLESIRREHDDELASV
jgi:hypothetical protein